MWLSVWTAICLFLCAAHCSWGLGQYTRTATYNDEVVVRCTNKLKGTIQLLQKNTDVWNIGLETVDLRIQRRTFARVQKYVPECRVLIGNVEEHVQRAEVQMFPSGLHSEEVWAQSVLETVLQTKPSLAECQAAIESWEKARFQEGTNAWFKEYHNYEAIVAWYKNKVDKNPNLMKMDSIGESYLGRDMPVIRMTASNDPHRKKVYFQCQIHAREWISGAVCMYIVDQLASKYGHDSGITDFFNTAELMIVPFVNPDGYVYTWNKDRLWRKNRRKSDSSNCVGVDINRNFREGWKSGEGEECQEDYGGTSSASEIETQNIIKYWESHGPIVGAIDWHSYGQLILRPWGKIARYTKHNERLQKLGDEMATIIKQNSSTVYTSKTSFELYQCFGIASDWFYSDDAASNNGGYRAIGYVIELRDSGTYGFVLPSDEIIPTGEEVFPAVVHFLQSVVADSIIYVPHDA